MGLLAIAVGPVCGLILGRLVPPGVKVDDDVRRCQVQPGAAGLQRDEEHRGCPGVEGFHQLRPLFLGGRALQGEAGNMRFVQPGADPVQHGGELGEQKNLVAVFHHGLTQLHAGIQLAGFPLVVLKAQVGVTADLPQPGQRCQNLQFSLLPVQLFHRGLHTGAVGFPLLLRQGDPADVFFLRRQLLQNLGFPASEQEGLHQPPELGGGLRVLTFYDGLFQLLPEGGVGVEVAAHEEVKQIPQLAEPVFHGGARQHEPLAAVYLLHRLGGQGGRVFDVLGLVQHAAVKFLLGVVPNVLPQQLVGRDPHIRVRAVTQGFPLGGGAKDQPVGQLGGEFCQLLAPVVDERNGADHQRGFPRGFPGNRCQKRNDLQRLAKAHFVCQNAAKAVAFQGFQPLKAGFLIGPEYRFHALRQGVVALRQGLEIADHLPEAAVPADLNPIAAAEHSVQEQPPVGWQRDGTLSQFLPGKLEHLGHFRHFFIAGAIQLQIPSVGEPVVFPAQQKALVQSRQLLLRKTAGVQREGQQSIGHGEPYAGGGGLDTPALQPVTEVDLAILPEAV